MAAVSVGAERHWGAGRCPGKGNWAGEGSGAQMQWGAAYSLMRLKSTEFLGDKHNIYFICVFQCTFFCILTELESSFATWKFVQHNPIEYVKLSMIIN